MARVIGVGEHDPDVFLVETHDGPAHRHSGRVYDRKSDVLHPEMLVASIAARGYWVEVDPADYADVPASLSARLR
jgi:hypothetical protein